MTISNMAARLLSAATIATAFSGVAFAQTEIATGANAAGISAVNDQITDVEDQVRRDFERAEDVDRFGPGDRRQGLAGSIALTYSGQSGNAENQDFSLSGRMSFNQGPRAQSVAVLMQFGEDNNGNKDKEEVSAIYDGQYYFNDQLYAFALGRFSIDGLANGDRDYRGQPDEEIADKLGDYARDGFLGFGPGYRILNTETTSWRVQAGIGYRYTQTGAQKSGWEFGPDGERRDVKDSSDSGMGYIVSSRLYHRFNDQLFITNDTDYLSSKNSDDVITNLFSVNFKLSEQLASRISYSTEYQANRPIRNDNTLGVSVVYGF